MLLRVTKYLSSYSIHNLLFLVPQLLISYIRETSSCSAELVHRDDYLGLIAFLREEKIIIKAVLMPKQFSAECWNTIFKIDNMLHFWILLNGAGPRQSPINTSSFHYLMSEFPLCDPSHYQHCTVSRHNQAFFLFHHTISALHVLFKL